jgi:DNA-binding CsgD family transcriptional regulator
MGTDLTNQELADVLNTTAATVAVTLQRLRKKASAKTKDVVPVVIENGSEANVDG